MRRIVPQLICVLTVISLGCDRSSSDTGKDPAATSGQAGSQQPPQEPGAGSAAGGSPTASPGQLASDMLVPRGRAGAATVKTATSPEEATKALFASLQSWMAAAPYVIGTWQERADNEGKDMWQYARTVEMDDKGGGRVVVRRKHSRTGSVESVRWDDFTYRLEDQMLEKWQPGLSGVSVVLKKAKEFPQRDGSVKAVETSLVYHPTVNWKGLDTSHTDTDDYAVLELQPAPPEHTAPPFAIADMPRLSFELPSRPETKKQLEDVLSLRRRFWIEHLHTSERYKKLVAGRFGWTGAYDFKLELDERGTAVFKCTQGGNTGINFSGRLVDASPEWNDSFAPHGTAPHGPAADIGYVVPSESAYVNFQDGQGRRLLRVVCHYDAKRKIRWAVCVPYEKQGGGWARFSNVHFPSSGDVVLPATR